MYSAPRQSRALLPRGPTAVDTYNNNDIIIDNENTNITNITNNNNNNNNNDDTKYCYVYI